MHPDDYAVRELYDHSVRIPLLWRVDAYLSGTTETSRYRQRAIAALHLQSGDVVLDAACGTGLNFRLLERHLGPEGRIVGVDLSAGVLREARNRTVRHAWRNIELVQESILTHAPARPYDAVLCTMALSVIPDWRGAVRHLVELVRPGGRVAALGMQRSTRRPQRWLNEPLAWIGRWFAVDIGRDVAGRFLELLPDSEVETYAGGWYYVLAATRPIRGGEAHARGG